MIGSMLTPQSGGANDAIVRCAWALSLAAKAEQGADAESNTLAAQFAVVLGAISAIATALPAPWRRSDAADAAALSAALAAEHGAPAAEASASAVRAEALLSQAVAAIAAPQQQPRGGRRAAAGAAQPPPQQAAMPAAPQAAAQALTAAACWLEGRYAEQCLCSDGSGDSPAVIDERGFAGWAPWRPSQQAAAGVAGAGAAVLSATTGSSEASWPSG